MDISIDINSIINSAQDGQWLLFAGLLLTALVQVARVVIPKLKKIPSRVRPWIIMTIGVLAAGGGVLAGGGSWQAAIIAGVTVGLGSLGAYDLIKGPAEQAGLYVARQGAARDAARDAAAGAESEKPAEPPAEPVEPAKPEAETSTDAGER
jgi:hypothetical protein